jgi:hypothetical protein
MKKLHIYSCLLMGYWLATVAPLAAQADSSALRLSAYLETYYSFDFSEPASQERPAFFYNHNRHNEVNVNLALLRAAWQEKNVRANVGLMAGTYPQYNLAGEQGLLKNIFEANAGIKLSARRELWIDAGVLPSHIGFESAIGRDCWTLSRSLMAENSPYYEAGARLSYTSSDARWYGALLYLNGWQRIQRLPGNQTPALGAQLLYTANGLTLNWSAYAGNEQPNGARQWRYFNNLYATWKPNDRLGLTAGLDAGWQQRPMTDSQYDAWLSWALIGRYALSDKLAAAVRLEFYEDEAGVIIASEAPKGFSVYGLSANLDYAASAQALFRIEGRWLGGSKAQFVDAAGNPSQQYFFLTAAMAVSLAR